MNIMINNIRHILKILMHPLEYINKNILITINYGQC
jgi:hypothetical protein